MSKHKLVLFGGNGFIGSHLTASLSPSHFLITSVGRQIVSTNINKDISCISIGDPAHGITSHPGLHSSLKHANTVVLLHGSKCVASDYAEKKAFYDQYIEFTLRLIREIYSLNPFCKLIYLSSGGLCKYSASPLNHNSIPVPTDLYSESRLIVEQYLYQEFASHRFLVLRTFSVYGFQNHFDNKVRGLIDTLIHNRSLTRPTPVYVSLECKRNFIHIDDVIAALAQSIAFGGSSQTFNVGYPISYPIRDILDLIDSNYELVEGLMSEDIPSIPDIDLSYEKYQLSWTPLVSPLDYIKKALLL